MDTSVSSRPVPEAKGDMTFSSYRLAKGIKSIGRRRVVEIAARHASFGEVKQE